MEPAPVAAQVQARLIPTRSEQHALDFLEDPAVLHHVFLLVVHVVLCNAIDRGHVFHLAVLPAVQIGIPNKNGYTRCNCSIGHWLFLLYGWTELTVLQTAVFAALGHFVVDQGSLFALH